MTSTRENTREAQHERFARAMCSLEGLAVGDALGNRFFLYPDTALYLIAERALPAAPWPYTDDTQMALSIISMLRQYGAIKQNNLIASFAAYYEPARGYGPSMHGQLRALRAGQRWKEVATSQFAGQGSFGNGAAMRIAPLGAYFADDMDSVVEQARSSAEVTHAHPEGIAGAIAVAVAAAWAWRLRASDSRPSCAEFLDLILPLVPESEVRTKIRRARNISEQTAVEHAAAMLGNGSQISAQDTVPFTLWCAASQLDNYEEALWLTLRGLGDIDTNCAIVGGIVALSKGVESIPEAWRQAREPFPQWPFGE
ncbi:MAG TPA: ADP-ribosylglycohydrolase family protein [Ktedonosporobacter sp.]|nr:ADP-ribosylglycohydrolase family protein [Ktedonosporobacter sp.]